MTGTRCLSRVLGVTMLILTACAPFESDGVHHHRDGEGVLTVGSGDGGAFIIPPSSPPRRTSVTFGFFASCTEKGRAVRLEKMTWSSEGAGSVVTPYLRRIPPEDERNDTDEYQPVVLEGTPWSMKPRLGGLFVRDLDGEIVSGSRCGERDTSAERDDFVLVVTAGPEGAKVNKFSVYYTAGNKRYAVDVNYDFVMCGTEVTDPDCPVSPGPASPRD